MPAAAFLSIWVSSIHGTTRAFGDNASVFKPAANSRLQENRQTHIRMPHAAGSYYPETSDQLFSLVGSMMAAASYMGCKGVKAILVPHAGYAYGGSVAAASFKQIDAAFKRVFILGSDHSGNVPLKRVSLPTYSHYAIPSAAIPISPILAELRPDPMFMSNHDAHNQHIVETALPFLHYIKGQPQIPDYAIIPMILGQMDTKSAKALAEKLYRYADANTLFIFSLDLSHGQKGNAARQQDLRTIQTVLSLDSQSLSESETYGNQVLSTMVELAKVSKWEPAFLKYINSADTSGDRDEGAGYGSIVFHQPFALTSAERKALLRHARFAIASNLGEKIPSTIGSYLADSYPILRLPKGVFVTLEKNGKLRGCIGELFPRSDLEEAVRRCAVKSATEDPRFSPVSLRELDTLTISISVLEFPRRIENENPRMLPKLLNQGKDGLILVYKGRQSTFLPKVWEDLPDPVSFLSQLCLKQGSPADCWQSQAAVFFRYGTYDFSESTAAH